MVTHAGRWGLSVTYVSQKRARNDATDVLRSAFGRDLAIFTAIKLQTERKKPFWRSRERLPVSAKERAPSSRVRVSSKTGEQKDFRKYFRSTTQHEGEKKPPLTHSLNRERFGPF